MLRYCDRKVNAYGPLPGWAVDAMLETTVPTDCADSGVFAEDGDQATESLDINLPQRRQQGSSSPKTGAQCRSEPSPQGPYGPAHITSAALLSLKAMDPEVNGFGLDQHE